MNYLIKAFAAVLLFAAVIHLSACGKMSNPSPLEGTGYPHDYPRH